MHPSIEGCFSQSSPPLDQHLNMPITLSEYFIVRNQRHHEARLSFRLHIPLKKLFKYISKLCWQQGASISRFQSPRYPVESISLQKYKAVENLEGEVESLQRLSKRNLDVPFRLRSDCPFCNQEVAIRLHNQSKLAKSIAQLQHNTMRNA